MARLLLEVHTASSATKSLVVQRTPARRSLVAGSGAEGMRPGAQARVCVAPRGGQGWNGHLFVPVHAPGEYENDRGQQRRRVPLISHSSRNARVVSWEFGP